MACLSTRGFESFRRGTFGQAGQNLYVSRAGILQRIHLFDLDRDGYLDLLFCNAQEHWERPPAYVYDPRNGYSRVELIADGACTGAVGDLTGDGLDDLALGMHSNGIAPCTNAMVYYGTDEGWSEAAHGRLPLPLCTSVAIGDIRGSGRSAIIGAVDGKVRVFEQGELGLESTRFTDYGIPAVQLTAADLDEDGCADLVILDGNGGLSIYWGGPDGLDKNRALWIEGSGVVDEAPASLVSTEEAVGAITPLACVVQLNDRLHVVVFAAEEVRLVPVNPDRTLGPVTALPCRRGLSAAAGDVDGDGCPDLVVAARDRCEETECSWVFWGGSEGFSAERRTALPSCFACDVAVADLDGDGREEIVLCQHRDAESWSTDSLIYRAGGEGIDPEPLRLATEGARRVLVSRRTAAGHPRLVFVNQFSRNALGRVKPRIYLGGPDGFVAERFLEVPGFGTVAGVGCDVNDDGIPDLVLANCAENAMHLDPGSFVYLGREDGFREEPDIVLPTRTAMNVVVGDLDRDGWLDAVFSSFSTPEILIFRGTPEGFDPEHPQRLVMEHDGVTYKEGRRLCLADLNNDGWLDLVVTSIQGDRAFILWGGPEGFAWERRHVLSVQRPSTPLVADLTGNGYLDLIIAGHKRSASGPHDSFVYIYWNGPEGLREERRQVLPANATLGVAVGDLNGDGVPDLFVGNYSDGWERDVDSYIYWGSREPGETLFSERRRTRVKTHSAAGCLAADFDGDGYLDLAVANHKVEGDHVGESFVYRGGPDGLDLAEPIRLPTAGPHGMWHTPPGNQADRGDEEYYVSEPLDLPAGAQLAAIRWEGEVPPTTWVRAQLRVAETEADLEAAPWLGPAGEGTWYEAGPVERMGGRWGQYRLALGAVNGGRTPRLSAVHLDLAPIRSV